MIGNKSYLKDYEEIDRGFVAFGGNSKGKKITGKGIEYLIDLKVKVIRCDNETEFKNRVMNQLCEIKGIKREFSIARTPQQNGVVERKNRTLIEAARTMLANSKLPTTFWAEAVNTACYVENRVLVIMPQNKTPYELCKFDGNANEGFFVGYSTNSKAFRVFNNRTRIVEENLHVQFSENTSNVAGSGPNWLFDIDALTNSMNYKPVVAGNQSNGNAGTKACDNAGKARVEIDSLDAGFKPSGEEEKKDAEDLGNESGNPTEGKDSEVPSTEEPIEDQRVNQELDASINSTNNINTASNVNNTNNVNAVSSTINATVTEVNAVDLKTSIELPNDLNMPELEDIVYSDDDEDVGAEANMNSLDAIMHMDVKSAFLYGKIEEEVYVCQPPGFEDPDFPDRRGKIDKTLSIRKVKSDILLVQVHVDDIIFGFTKKSLCIEFEKMMHKKFQMSSIGELTCFLRLQVKQKEDGIFISQDKYVTEILKKFGFTDVKTASTPMETYKPLLKDADGEDVDEHLYRSMIRSLIYLTSSRPDIMFTVCACARYQVNLKVSHLHAVKRIFRYLKDRKSTTGGCQFLWCRLILWQCKKQTVVSNSTTDVEYIAASNCYGQSTICIVKNPVFHSKTKRIEIRHHFNRDSNENKLIQMIKIHTDQNVADLLTKAFDNGIGVNAGDSKLMLLGLTYCWVTTAVRNTLKVKGLRKPTESEGFEEIVDFMNANHIKYALTINPTIYYSCVKQFWDTVKSKMVNEEVQLQALVDKKKVIITKSTIRRDLQLEDANGVDCLPNAAIFELLTLRGKQKSKKSKKKNTKVPQPSGSTDNVPDENVPTTSNDPLLSGKDRLKLTKLIDLCTNLQKNVLDLEKAKIDQDSEIASIKKKVKKLERSNKSRTLGLKRLRKVGSARRVESFDEASLDDQDDASKQGRKIADIDVDTEVTLIDETQGRNNDNLMFDTRVLDDQEVEVEKVVSTAKVTTKSATTTIDELTMAQTLIEIKAAKPKVRGVMIQEPSEFTTTTTTPTASKPSQDKGKEKMIESEKPLKKKDQIMYDQEVALNLQAQLQAELEEEERLTRQKEEEANIALIESWDNTQAMMDADYQMAQQLQAEEQEQLSIEEKSKLFVQLLEARKKHFAEMRAREKRNKPPTQAQQRKLYCNYLKNMEGYTLKQLKGLKFEVIKDMFDKAFKRVNTFVDYKTELVEGSEKRAEDSTKRAGTELEQEVAKKQKIDDAKVDDDQEEARMKELINNVPDEEEVAINAIPLATKPLCIVDWKIIKDGKISQFQIIRADGSSKRYSVFIHMLRNFNKEDLETLWKLVKAKHESLVWRTLQNEKVLIWKLFDSCGVHFLMLQSMHIFMLVEKRYPLTPITITGMLNKKLQGDRWNEICYQLLKLITKQLKNPRSGRIVRIKSFIRLFGITAALIKVSAAQEKRVNVAGTKLQLLTELQLLMDKD
ncbi:uncharacterized mitochondrial protein-like protein [Tanacetum coccineum]|uniref:Uncharacterized mitochondrial protein-like protein n=1 Tax=Tanacetum coccineum TaxID=301880 RepID=A0ABQ5G8T6_9ASTR